MVQLAFESNSRVCIAYPTSHVGVLQLPVVLPELVHVGSFPFSHPLLYLPLPLPLPLEVGLLNPVRGSGECCKLPQQGQCTGRASTTNAFP